jgi:polyhydroxyalkanoate synthesis regulator phasin
MREQLTEIAGCGRHWAVTRALYMISVMDQLDQGQMAQSQATDYMWDVIRQLDQDSDSPVIAQQLRSAASTIGQLGL